MSTIDTSQHYDYLFALTLFALNNSSLSLVRAIKSYVQRGNNAFASRINCHVEIGRVATGSRERYVVSRWCGVN